MTGKTASQRRESVVIAALILFLLFGCFSQLSKEPISEQSELTTKPAEPPHIFSQVGLVRFPRVPEFTKRGGEESYSIEQGGSKVYFTLDSELQTQAEELFQHYNISWGSLVAVEPRTGRIIALVSYSSRDPNGENVALSSHFPAASLFKLITSSAAIEREGLQPDSPIRYRGGDYTLNPNNYYPDVRRDRRSISFEQALGRSCNPAFARIALDYLSPEVLEQYAMNYGFDSDFSFEAPVEPSHFTVPLDLYETARTAAGFGDVKISPLHAALITASIANGGTMMRPFFVDHIVGDKGTTVYQASPISLRQTILPSTARQLLQMMTYTVTNGTARKHFRRSNTMEVTDIAAKTGTLSGDNPIGVYHWLVAAAPVENPEIAIAVLVIDPGRARLNASGLGKRFLEIYFGERLGSGFKSVQL